jgi:V/A-type H+/Na+-transporting ATPase subunit A
VTAIGAVSPPGGDTTEPVTAHTERFVRAVWSLDRGLAYARHYPAVTWRRSFSKDVSAMGAWYAQAGDPGWLRARERAVRLLAEADRLAPMVELVGLPALPGPERVTLVAARLLREAVLQQSALSERDASCGPSKAAALLGMVLALYDRSLELVEEGVPPAAIEASDLSGASRVRDEVGPDDAAGVERRRDELLATLDRTREQPQ